MVVLARSKGQAGPQNEGHAKQKMLLFDLLLCLAQDGKMQTHSHAILIKHHKTKLNAKSSYYSPELNLMS